MPLGIDPTNDFVFRLAFGDPANSDVLIDLLNAILELTSPIREVEILNPCIPQEYPGDKLAILDIHARDSEGRQLFVEMQTSVTRAIRERLIYYATCLYSGQLQEGDDYHRLQPTIAICISSEVLISGSAAGHHRFVLADLQEHQEFSDKFQIHTVELPKYDARLPAAEISSAVHRWAWWFQRAAEFEASVLRRELPVPAIQKATGVLEMIARTPAQRAVYESRQKAIRDELNRQYEARVAIEEAREEGEAAGLSRGLEKGHEKGLEQGLRRGRIEQILMLQQLLRSTDHNEANLSSLSAEELQKCISDLQARINGRRS